MATAALPTTPPWSTGFAQFEDRPVVVIGNQKGRDTKQKLLRNFGMANPEGYRKALRVMELGSKFGLPIICFIDTPGAYPGIGAEERGQAEAIAYNLKEICKLQVPIVVLIHGEGGSGGALAIAVGDEVLMHENSIYSVISPESCSSILWRDWDHKQEAARVLKMTAEDLYRCRSWIRSCRSPRAARIWTTRRRRNCCGRFCALPRPAGQISGARSLEAPPGKASPPGDLCDRGGMIGNLLAGTLSIAG